MSHFKVEDDHVELKIVGETVTVRRADNDFWCLGAQRAGELILAVLEEDGTIQTREDFAALVTEFLRDLEIVRKLPSPKIEFKPKRLADPSGIPLTEAQRLALVNRKPCTWRKRVRGKSRR